jgi:hypothetical protein
MKAGKKNPRSGAFITSEREAAWNDQGEFNASSKEDLFHQVNQLIEAHVQGKAIAGIGDASNPDLSVAEEQQMRAADLQEAYSDPSGKKLQVMGDTIVEELIEVGRREGFTRSCLGVQPVPQGQDGKVRIKYKQSIAVVATSATTVKPVKFRERYVRPPIYYLNANLLVDDIEVKLSPVGIMEEMFEDGLESTMVTEDRLTLQFWNALTGIYNTPIGITGSLTPEIWATLKEAIEAWGLPASTAVMAYTFWKDISGGTVFSGYFDPVTKYQLVLEGRLGSLMGVSIITDAFREPKLRVLPDDTMYVLGPPNSVGVITQHQELTPYQVDLRNQGQPVSGWFLEAIQGTTSQNPRSIISARRV